VDNIDDNSPDFLYEVYANDPTPSNLNKVVESLRPVINYGIKSTGAYDDPYIKSQARLVAADAVKSFNPSSGARIHSWVSTQMPRLKRMKRESQSVVKVPERIQLDAYHLYNKEMEFMDKHEREPDLHELADLSSMSIKRIQKVREATRKTPSEFQLPDTSAESSSDFAVEAADYVYGDLDYTDRKILEFKTGYGGSPILPPKEVATRLKLTPSQLTRRSARIALKMQEIEDALTQTQ
jgi:DNA-directed RNA polymerase sigma subunit (sigma70/sigma32)